MNRRLKLIREETDELEDALEHEELEESLDGIADLLYVVLGTAVEMGVDIEPIFREVHRSNMTKIGGHKREDGKWIKPKEYNPVDFTGKVRGLDERTNHQTKQLQAINAIETAIHENSCLHCGCGDSILKDCKITLDWLRQSI
jgi:predicted HAD superfamily Cof-like phosphohydrolase